VTAIALGPDWLNPQEIIVHLGAVALVGLALIVFAECGLLIGFFLPGDSLLFAAGIAVANGGLASPLWVVCVVLVVAAVAGNLAGYGIGRLVGPSLFDRPNSRLFRREYVEKTQTFFDRHGGRAIVLARFVPVVRTFITAMAGVGRMSFARFALFSTVGAVIWAAGVTVLGYYLGQREVIRNNLEPMLLLIVLVSVLPAVVEVLRSRRRARSGQPEHAQPVADREG
jgi:membrane-associated protein